MIVVGTGTDSAKGPGCGKDFGGVVDDDVDGVVLHGDHLVAR